MAQFRCTMFTQGNAQGIPAVATTLTTGLVVERDGDRFELHFHVLQVSRGGYNDRMLVFAADHEGSRVSLYFEDHSIAEAIRNYRLPPGLTAQLKNSSGTGRMKWVMLWVALIAVVVALLYFGGRWGLNAAIDVAVDQIPVELEAELGRSAAAESLGNHSVCSAPAVNEAVDEIGRRLVEGLQTNSYEFHFLVIDDPEMNAFALPAGYVFVNFGLIEAADSPDQVAGVLAHEIQHAMRRHGLRNVVARLGLTLIVGLAVGDVQGMGGVVGGMAAEMAGLSFSREQEEEADRLGLELLYAANFDPDGLPAFFEKLKEKEKKLGMALPSFLSTHPDTDSRVAGLRALIHAQGKAEVTPIAIGWDKAKAECRPIPWADPDKKVMEPDPPRPHPKRRDGPPRTTHSVVPPERFSQIT